MASGFTQTKLPMKVNGLQQKNMAKEPKHGRMDIFTKVNLKRVSGTVQEFYFFLMVQHMKVNGPMGFMNGQGTFTWSDGKQKTGIWKNGSFQEQF